MPSLSPNHLAKRAWDSLVLAITVLMALEVPLRLALDSQRHPSGFLFTQWPLFDALTSVVFLVDMALRAATAFQLKGQQVTSLKAIRHHYLRTWFLIDFAASVPFDAFAGLFLGAAHPLVWALTLLRLLRCVHLVRMSRHVGKRRFLQRINPGLIRMGVFLFWIFLIAHWVACAWLMLGAVDRNLDVVSAYLRALYWCVTTLTTVGYGDITPKGNLQLIFTMAVEVLGVGVYGYIIGNVANLIANLDVQRTAHTERLNAVNAYLKFHKVPLQLRARISEYFEHIFENRIDTGGDEFLEDLPPSLRAQIAIFLNSDIIKRVPLFKRASEAFITELGLALKEVVFIPGDAVIKQGEIGDSMYFVSTGTLEVVSEEGDVVAELKSGDFFGEMALLSSRPRNATILANGYCHLYTIDADTFQRVITRFPVFEETLRQVATRREEEVSGVHRMLDR